MAGFEVTTEVLGRHDYAKFQDRRAGYLGLM
jgi:hypothetical protein